MLPSYHKSALATEKSWSPSTESTISRWTLLSYHKRALATKKSWSPSTESTISRSPSTESTISRSPSTESTISRWTLLSYHKRALATKKSWSPSTESTISRSPSTESTISDNEIVSQAAIVSESFYIPKKNRSKPLGEDAHFISNATNTIGVADGASSWADAGEYARNLMLNASVSAQNQNKTSGFVDPKTVLWEAFEETKEQGSSSACILTLRGQFLHCANVGDSKFVLIRAGKIVFGSRVQQKKFNCPYQLGRGKGGHSPDIADVYTYKVAEGDIVVMGTDGLFDNVGEKRLEEFVKMGLRLDVGLERTAKAIAKFARQQSRDPKAYTPYRREASRAGVKRRARGGGKYDDVTVIVARVYC